MLPGPRGQCFLQGNQYKSCKFIILYWFPFKKHWPRGPGKINFKELQKHPSTLYYAPPWKKRYRSYFRSFRQLQHTLIHSFMAKYASTSTGKANIQFRVIGIYLKQGQILKIMDVVKIPKL